MGLLPWWCCYAGKGMLITDEPVLARKLKLYYYIGGIYASIIIPVVQSPKLNEVLMCGHDKPYK